MRTVAVLAVLALLATPRGADEITVAQAAAVERWVAAVADHEPGRKDEQVEMVMALTFEKRQELNAGMGLFLSALAGTKPVVIKSQEERRISNLAVFTKKNPGANTFLKRAAVLHADAAFTRDIQGAKPPDPPGPPPSVSSPSALLSSGSLFLNRDGEILGQTPTEWNWPFARSLLDLISPSPSSDPFVATWYHATTAFMLQHHIYGEAVTHLGRASVVVPDDARVLFDRASYSEIQGLPRSQVLLSDQDIANWRASAPGGRPSLIRTPTQDTTARLGIPPADVADEEAERLFRRALKIDPSFVEARVRLGRLLVVRARHQEAASELATALAANPDGPVLYFAHLFAGRAAQALGKISEAAEHYKAADLLFPGSQSARLARSQVALLESDVAGALASIEHLDRSSSARDPWWQYHLAAGRDADALLRTMWAQVPKP